MRLSVSIVPQTLSVSFDPASAVVGFGNPVAREVVDRDPYTGDYVVTPGTETVVLATKDKRMTDHVTVNPIPQNYGLITQIGNIIMVS